MPGWVGRTIIYAVVIWGVDAVYGLLKPSLRDANERAQEVAAGIRFVIPLGLAFLIGLRLRAWGWVLSPFLATVVTMLAFSVAYYLRKSPSERQQAGAGLILAIGATVIDAALATLAATAGVPPQPVWGSAAGGMAPE